VGRFPQKNHGCRGFQSIEPRRVWISEVPCNRCRGSRSQVRFAGLTTSKAERRTISWLRNLSPKKKNASGCATPCRSRPRRSGGFIRAEPGSGTHGLWDASLIEPFEHPEVERPVGDRRQKPRAVRMEAEARGGAAISGSGTSARSRSAPVATSIDQSRHGAPVLVVFCSRYNTA
jgi:hypothetical protein